MMTKNNIFEQTTFDISGFSENMYYIRIYTNEKTFLKKIIKM